MDTKTLIGSITRTIAALLAGWFIKRGIIAEDQSSEFIGAMTGALLFISTLLWSVYQKKQAAKAEEEKIALAIQAPPSTTVAQVEEKHAELKAIQG